jgi:CYTH domain-containing protein
MGVEIERKFLVRSDAWREASSRAVEMVQGYVCVEAHVTVRVRVAGDQGWLTLKGRSVEGKCGRPEYEYQVPVEEARELLERFARHGHVRKIRHYVEVLDRAGKRIWEVDEFLDKNAGLILAEVELSKEGEEVILPDWVGDEVTADRRYQSGYLARCPYVEWASRFT